MFDTDRPGSIFAAVSPPADVAASRAEPARVPLERLEAQICELAGHLAAATCRFLVLLGDFDARRGWASWEMGSCAQWLSWKCQMSSGTARGHVEDGPAISISTAQMLSCGAALSYRPDGTPVPSSPPLPEPGGGIGDTHDAAITPETIIPPWYGERLDLDHAIYICLANARTREERERHQDVDPASRGRVTIYEPEDWPERIRQYEARTPRSFAPVLVPIQV